MCILYVYIYIHVYIYIIYIHILAELGQETMVEDLAKILFADLIQSESRYIDIDIDRYMYIYIYIIYIYLGGVRPRDGGGRSGQDSICGSYPKRVQVCMCIYIYVHICIYAYIYLFMYTVVEYLTKILIADLIQSEARI